MTLLARKLSKPACWADYEDPSLWNGANFPFPALRELDDGFATGLSCFAVRNRRDPILRRLALALSMRANGNVTAAEFRFVSVRQLLDLGIKHQKTDSDLQFKDLNKLHYDISELSGAQSIELARILNSSVKIISAKEITKELARCLVRGEVNLNDIRKEQILELNKNGNLRATLTPVHRSCRSSVHTSATRSSSSQRTNG